MPVLHGNHYEIWGAAGQPVYQAYPAITSARAGDAVFGMISFPDCDGEALARRIYEAYEDLFAFSAGSHLLRIWNYMPRINQASLNLERYRHFNLGRHKAFQTYYAGKLPPAASCLGTSGESVVIYFLLGGKAGLPIENPRQIAAYDYPAQYGPKSPDFSRALLGEIAGERTLFISGTASIVGHQSLHLGAPEKQTVETLVNINAVLDEAEKHGFKGSLDRAELKVYVRKPEQLEAIRSQVEQGFPAAGVIYLNADICREELLVEIEAVVPGG